MALIREVSHVGQQLANAPTKLSPGRRRQTERRSNIPKKPVK
ncbi:hypothetical protein CES86_0111 [Brucella lupini]|uniref:Uncharacterized protein n=1 Tax=Brucella lupini TaxID=255457 RepID=A0A256GZ05_9HYPH|nr:hypothetical protein CES86_0111 [Brucella lupini]